MWTSNSQEDGVNGFQSSS